ATSQVTLQKTTANNGFRLSIQAPAEKCVTCTHGSHRLQTCPKFFDRTPSERTQKITRMNACTNCLSVYHTINSSKSRFPCHVCKRNHHTLLHHTSTRTSASTTSQLTTPYVLLETAQPSSSQPSAVPSTSAAAECAVPIGASPSTANGLVAQGRSGEIALLATANILIRSRSGVFVPCRALLDSGSQVHVITSRLASQLELHRRKSYVAVSGIGDTGFATDGFSVYVLLRSYCSEYSALVNAVIAANITDLHPSFSLDVSSWNIPSNLTLADPQFFRPQRIDLLIGASLFYDLLCVGQIQLSAGLPVLQKTRLGWVVCGGGSHL
ncbi:hypothetical protein KR067_006409, partial [Drosophila pandora]